MFSIPSVLISKAFEFFGEAVSATVFQFQIMAGIGKVQNYADALKSVYQGIVHGGGRCFKVQGIGGTAGPAG